MPRTRARRTPVGLIAAALVAALVPLTAVIPQSQAIDTVPPVVPVAARASVVPKAPVFSAAIDGASDYQAQSQCTPAPKPGALKLARLITATYGRTPIGIARSCSIGGLSEHKEGRALDWMVSMRVPSQRAQAESFLTWLLATDQYGNAAAMAKRLGIMYIGWNNLFWRGYDSGRGWTELKGCLTDPRKKAAGYDTYCHRNHVHLSLSWDGAAGLTSYWTGTPLPDACQAPWGGSGTTTAASTDLVPVTPVRVLDTRGGVGVDAPCRLAGGSSWDPSRHDAVVQVTGRGDVPTDGVGAVAVRVTVARSSAPTPTVSVRSTANSPSIPVVTALTTLATATTTVVPVASDGTIRVGIDRGGIDAVVEVVAWAPLAVVVPPSTAGTSPGDPVLGATHVVRSTLAYATGTHPLAPGESRTVHLVGIASGSAAGLSGVALTMTASRTSAAGVVGILAPSGRSFLGMVRTSTALPRTTQAIVPTTTGDVVLRNASAVPASVTLLLDGWFATTATADGTPLSLLAAPVRLIDSTHSIGLAGAVTSVRARVVTLTGRTVPVGARAVLLAVDVRGGSTASTLALSSRATVPAVSFAAGQWAHETVLVALRSDGLLWVATPSLGTHVRLTVLGYVA